MRNLICISIGLIVCSFNLFASSSRTTSSNGISIDQKISSNQAEVLWPLVQEVFSDDRNDLRAQFNYLKVILKRNNLQVPKKGSLMNRSEKAFQRVLQHRLRRAQRLTRKR